MGFTLKVHGHFAGATCTCGTHFLGVTRAECLHRAELLGAYFNPNVLLQFISQVLPILITEVQATWYSQSTGPPQGTMTESSVVTPFLLCSLVISTCTHKSYMDALKQSLKLSSFLSEVKDSFLVKVTCSLT